MNDRVISKPCPFQIFLVFFDRDIGIDDEAAGFRSSERVECSSMLDRATRLEQQGPRMNDFEERYQSPVTVESNAHTTRLTKEEWRYAGKIFVMVTVGAALFRGAWPAWQAIAAAREFRRDGEVAALLAVGAMRHVGSVVALFGMCMALILVVRRRAKAGVPPPKSGLFWPMFLIVPLSAPLVGLVMCGVCVGSIWLAFGHMRSFIIKDHLRSFLLENAHAGIALGAASSLLSAGLSAELARGAELIHRWPILAGIALWFVTEWTTALLAYPVIFALARVGLAPVF